MERSSAFLRISGLIVVLFLTTIFLFCIQRDNPWDPQNGCPQPYKHDIIAETKPLIDSSMSRVDSLITILNTFQQKYISTTIYDSITKEANDSIYLLNESIKEKNRQIDSLNSTTGDCSTIQNKDTLTDSLTLLPLFDDVESLKNYRNSVAVESLKIGNYYTDADQRCSPQGVFEPWAKDSTLSIIKLQLFSWDSLIKNVEILNSKTSEYNQQKIAGYSFKRRTYNDSIRTYNAAFSQYNIYCGKQRLNTGESIRDSIAQLEPGDTLFLDSMTLNYSLRFTNIGTDTSDTIFIIGSPFMNTRLQPANFFVSRCANIRFVNIVFSGASGSGAKVEYSSSGISFENCIFSNNSFSGLEIVDSDVELKNCKIINNGASGIEMSTNGKNENMLYAKNLLVAHNKLYGIHSLSATVYISNATISDNGKDGIFLDIATKPVVLEYSNITFNNAYGLRRDNEASRIFSLYKMNIYGNTSGDFTTDTLHSVLNVDPHYVNKDENDYRIQNTSLLYNLNIGYIY